MKPSAHILNDDLWVGSHIYFETNPFLLNDDLGVGPNIYFE